MPPRRSTRSTASQSNTRSRRNQDRDDIVEEDQPTQSGNEQQQEEEEEEDQHARRSTRRASQRTSTRTASISAISARRKPSTSARPQPRSRRTANQDEDEDDDEEPAEEAQPDQEEDEDVQDEDPDVTAASSRRGGSRGRLSARSARDADDGSDDEGGPAQWKLLPRPPQPEISDQARKAAKKAGKQEVLRKSAELCRMALYHEYSKGALRRTAISQQLFNGDVAAGRALPMIMRYTNKTLRGTFAMELAEIKMGASATSTAYILRSVLPPAAVSVLTKPSVELGTLVKGAGIGADPLDKGKKRARSSGVNEVHDQAAQSVEAAALAAKKGYVGQRTYDAVAPPLDWKAADGQLGSMGLLYVILALILTNGRTLPNAQLRSQLRRLCLPPGEPLPIGLRIDGDLSLDAPIANHSNLIKNAPRSPAAEANLATIESFLATAVKMHYLEYAKSSTLAGGTQQAEGTAAPRRGPGRRSNNPGGANGEEAEEEDAFDWKWGPRAHVEVGEVAIGKFIAELWSLGASREDEEEEQDAAAVAAASQAIDEEEEDGDDGDGQRAGSSRRSGKQKSVPRKSASQKTAEQRAEREARLMRDIERAAGSQLT